MTQDKDHTGHDHDHDHPYSDIYTHPPQQDQDAGPWSDYQYLETAVRKLLVDKGVLTPEEIRLQMEKMDGRGPELGARVVARAWTDPDYKARLLQDGAAATQEIGIDIEATHLIVVENTSDVHNVVVCTLCSCYPRNLLGVPPEWYKARAYRSRAVHEPRAVLKEFGTEIPDSVRIRVHDSTADMRYVVLPQRPAGTDGMSEEALAALVTRDSMIGVSIPKGPDA